MTTRDIDPPRSVFDLENDLLRVQAQTTDPDHHGARVKLDGWNTGALTSTFYLSPDVARDLAQDLWDAAADAEAAFNRRPA